MREYKPLHYKAEDHTSGTEWAGTIMGLEILSWLVKNVNSESWQTFFLWGDCLFVF